MSKTTLELIIAGFLRGNSRQYAIIKSKITQYVYHQDYSQTVDKDEIISDTLTTLYNNLKEGRFRGDRLTAFDVYIYRIIRFKICNMLRKKSRIEFNDEIVAAQADNKKTSDEIIPDSNLARQILDCLDDKCRELLRLKFQEGWADREIADYYKKSKNSISTSICRCLKKAKKLKLVKDLL